MADSPLSTLTSLTAASLASGDLFYVVDVSAGTAGSKSITYSQLQTVFQPVDTDLTALAALASTGLVARTGSGTYSERTLTATNGLSISNGDGVSGNPVVGLSGGTLTLGDIPYATTGNALVRLGIGSSNNVLVVSGGVPAWSNALSLATLSLSGQLTSTVTTGTPPFVVASTDEVANLNAARLQGSAASAFASASHTQAWSTINSGGTVAISAGIGITGNSTSSPVIYIKQDSNGGAGIDLADFSGSTKLRLYPDGRITAYGAIGSYVASGTAPITAYSSATLCEGLNADLLDGSHASAFVANSNAAYTAGVLLQGTGAGNLLSTLPLGTSGQVLTASSVSGLAWTTPSAGTGSTTLPVTWVGMPSLTGFAPANGDIISVASTATTIFTVPTGKNMILNHLVFHNRNTAASTITTTLTVGSVARTILTSGSISATSSNLIGATVMAKAGEVFKATSSLDVNVNCLMRGYLVDDTVPLVRIEKFSGWSVGDNTLYTCPAGKMFVAVESSLLPIASGGSCVTVYNPTGSTRLFILNAVRSGGSPGVSNQLSTQSVTATTRSALTFSYFSLAEGDYVSLNVPTTDNYEVFILGYEIDA